MTMIILIVIDHIPGLHLRASEEGEIIGIDEDQVRFSQFLHFTLLSFKTIFLILNLPSSFPTVRRSQLRLRARATRC